MELCEIAHMSRLSMYVRRRICNRLTEGVKLVNHKIQYWTEKVLNGTSWIVRIQIAKSQLA